MSCTYQGNHDWPSLYEGDAFVSRDLNIQESSGTTLQSARLVFNRNGVDEKVLVNGDGLTLTNTAAGNWIITIEQWIVDIPVGTYVYDLKTVDADGIPRHYMGGTFRVLESIS